jgi:hypothetical protein
MAKLIGVPAVNEDNNHTSGQFYESDKRDRKDDCSKRLPRHANHVRDDSKAWSQYQQAEPCGDLGMLTGELPAQDCKDKPGGEKSNSAADYSPAPCERRTVAVRRPGGDIMPERVGDEGGACDEIVHQSR